ncbi:MAG: peptide chain release factor N(5)-glutamine methyltransferase [Tissierellia bacterium]|nr:peptide chain release factor N(5)-glutamine methyltransferase [Tissierellia bacterium]
MVISELLNKGNDLLNRADIENHKNEVKLILCKLLDKDQSFIHSYPDYELDKEIESKFFDIINKRVKAYPLQYIFGELDFYNLKLKVSESVLIPRKETEILIEKIIDIAKEFEEPKILDMATGSGAIAITLAYNILNSKIKALDISEDALNIARINKENYKLNNLELFKSDLFENVNERFDIIVSNPPYIKTSDIKDLQREIQYEPKIALDGGTDGLKFYKIIISKAYKYLNSGGYLAFEIGSDQAKLIDSLLNDYGYTDIKVIKDYAGHDRIIIAKVSGGEI